MFEQEVQALVSYLDDLTIRNHGWDSSEVTTRSADSGEDTGGIFLILMGDRVELTDPVNLRT